MALCIAVLLVGMTAGGCRILCPAPSPLATAGPGYVRLHWPACRTLQVAEQSCRRDELNHLVVRVRVRNVSESPYPARIRVEFADGSGKPEEGAEREDRQEFAPGTSAPIEWTSRSDSAASYVVEVRSARGFPWW
jgi:hypothetical protein